MTIIGHSAHAKPKRTTRPAPAETRPADATPVASAPEVPVKRERRVSPHTYDFRLDTLMFLRGGVGLLLDVKVDDRWTVGPMFGFARYKLGADSGFTQDYEVSLGFGGGRANWFHRGVFNTGFYVGPSLQFLDLKLLTRDSLGNAVNAHATGFLGSVVGGYGWFWRNFNLMLGGGFVAALGPITVDIESSAGKTTSVTLAKPGLALEASVGWTF